MSRVVTVQNLDGEPAGELSLPDIFETPFRPDLIRRAVVALQSHRFQPQGRNPMAGKRTTAESFGVGRDLARVPRVKGERHPKAGTAAFAPSTVKGRLTFPPNPNKRIRKRINRKERLLALASAISATASKEVVARRGHRVDGVANLPLVVADDIQRVVKTSDAMKALERLGLSSEIQRTIQGIKIRAGKGRVRGRPKKEPVGPLIVVARDEGVGRAVENIPGVQVAETRSLNVELLAPGTHPGRLTIWAESALKEIGERFTGAVK